MASLGHNELRCSLFKDCALAQGNDFKSACIIWGLISTVCILLLMQSYYKKYIVHLLQNKSTHKMLIHWVLAMHICISDWVVICSFVPEHSTDFMSIWPLGTNSSENLIKSYNPLFNKMQLHFVGHRLCISIWRFAKWRPFCSGLNVLTHWGRVTHICISTTYQHWFR